MYTVKQLSELAGVSVRTLHYYDEIGLFRPSAVGENGYRYYDEAALFRLQQILFFREMELGLLQIKNILDSPAFDLIAALRTHREALQAKIQRLHALTQTIDSTLMHLMGEVDMSKKRIFAGFNAEQEERYEREAAERYGEDRVRESTKRWKGYTPQQRDAIRAEGGVIYADLAALIGQDPTSEAVLAVMARWHQHIRHFYEPTLEILRGLGQLYEESPDFQATFAQFSPDLPAFIPKAVAAYCDKLGNRDSSAR